MITIFNFVKKVKAGCSVLGTCDCYQVNLFVPSTDFIAASKNPVPPAYIVVSGSDDFSMQKEFDNIEAAMVANHKITKQAALTCTYLEQLGFEYL